MTPAIELARFPDGPRDTARDTAMDADRRAWERCPDFLFRDFSARELLFWLRVRNGLRARVFGRRGEKYR